MKLSPRTNRSLVLLGLVALVGLYLYPVAILGRMPADRDNICFYYPLLSVFERGWFPLWNPYELAGSSLVANPQTALFYPPNWILPLVPTRAGFCVTTIVHYIWAGLGMFFLGRKLGLRRPAAFLAAATFMLGGYMQSRLLLRPLLLSAAWMPWSLALFWIATIRRSPAAAMGAGLAAAMTFLPGMYHNGVYTLGLLVAAAACAPFPRGEKPVRRILTRCGLLALAMILAVGFSAVSLLPAAELIPRTVRSGFDYTAASSSSVDWGDLPRAFLGFPRGPGIAEWHFFEKNTFPGWAGVFLALSAVAGIFIRRARQPAGTWNRAILVLLVFLAGFLVSLGSHTPVHRMLFYMPGGRFLNNPSRALVLCAIALSLAAGIGLEAWSRALGRGRRAAVITAALILVQIVGLFAYRSVLNIGFARPPYNPAPSNVEYLGRSRESGGRIASFDALKTIGGDFWPYHWPRFRHVLVPKIATVDRLEDIAGYDPLYIGDYAESVRALAGQSPGEDPWRVVAPGEPDPRLLNLLSVEYVAGNPHDRRVSDRTIVLSGRDTAEIPVDPGIGPCRSIRFQSSLSGAGGVVRGMKVATIQVTGRNRKGVKTGFYLPLRAGEEVADRFAGNDGGAYHPPIRVYRRFGVTSGRKTVIIEEYDTRIPFPDLPASLTPDEIVIRHFHTGGAMSVFSVVLEKDPPDTPFERVFEDEDGRFPVYRNRDAFPRARAVFAAETLPGREDLIARLRDPAWDPGKSVLLDEEVDGVPSDPPVDATASLSWAVRKPSKCALDANLSHGGLIVFSEVFYPGWRARVDGDSVPILQANGFLRAVPVPAGKHRVEMTYLPQGLLFGLLSAFGSAGVVIGMAGAVWWSRKKELDTLLAEGANRMTTKVLVVDDEPDTLAVLSESLKFYGFEVRGAKDGMEALEALEKAKPDVVLLDMNLPVLSGWEALQMMKADQELKDVPVIALTASTSVASEARALSLGCADFIPKPCEPKDVAAKIKRVLERQRLL